MNTNKLDRESVNFGDIKKIYLENKEDNHFKFYIISKEKDKREWLAQWGRIGARPQSKKYQYSQTTPWDQYQAKLKKGYTLINSDTFMDEIDRTKNETLEYLRSVGIDVDSLDDILL
jgi:predicted DNA-binding WGR domain protein